MLTILGPAGEISIKSRPVRARFLRKLVENVGDALDREAVPHTVRNEWHRLVVETPGEAFPDVLRRVFGVRKISPVACRCAPDLEEIVREGRRHFADRVRDRAYAVRTRRNGEHDFRSHDVNVRLGAALNEYGRVDLSHPDVTIHVDVRPDAAYLFGDQWDGPGGLPAGVEGRAVALVSGGFDSAVAAFQIFRRGVALDYVLCNLAGAAFERSVLRVTKVLADEWSYGTRPRVHVVDFEPIVAALRRDVHPRYVQVVLKRLMYRAGVRVADQIDAQAIVTGESIGQVSSQTLANLRAIDAAASLPVLRPLVGMDKEWIIDQTRRIGTYALSELVREYCAVSPGRPATAARADMVSRQENKIDRSQLDALVDARKVMDLAALDETDLVLPYLYTSEVPEGAVVLDCRPAPQYQGWHFPGAEHHELDELVTGYSRLDREAKYVICCAFGLQSAVVAEKMQRAGFEAYSFKGGTRALKALADERPA